MSRSCDSGGGPAADFLAIRSFNFLSASNARALFSSLLIPPKATSSFWSGDRLYAQSCCSAEDFTVSDRLKRADWFCEVNVSWTSGNSGPDQANCQLRSTFHWTLSNRAVNGYLRVTWAYLRFLDGQPWRRLQRLQTSPGTSFVKCVVFVCRFWGNSR